MRQGIVCPMSALVERTIHLCELEQELVWLQAQVQIRQQGDSVLVRVRGPWPSQPLIDRGYSQPERRRLAAKQPAAAAWTQGESPGKREEARLQREQRQDARELATAERDLREAILEWSQLTGQARIARVGGLSATGPLLESPRVKRWTKVRVNCAYCSRFGSPSYLVAGVNGDAFLCLPCLENGRETAFRSGRNDAMNKAYGRRRKY